jgi:hypothetical protein
MTLSSLAQGLRWPILSCALFTSACTSAWPRPVVGNASAVVVLLDYSQSFAPYSAADRAALDEVSKSIVEMIRLGTLQQPLKILWAAFGDNGLQPVEPCGPARVFQQRLTAGVSAGTNVVDPAAPFVSIDDFQAWMLVCTEAVQSTSRSAQKFTDVSGALAFANDALQDVGGNRVIVVFSDMLEDLPPERQPPVLKLAHASVLLAWRPGLDDQKQPSATTDRIETWSRRLQEAGASRVCAKAAQGLTKGEISNCLSN